MKAHVKYLLALARKIRANAATCESETEGLSVLHYADGIERAANELAKRAGINEATVNALKAQVK